MQAPDYIVDLTTGCWVWQKYTRQGYGRARRGDKLVTAHIWYWEQEHGPVPAGMQLDHTCHNGTSCLGGPDCQHRRCVNPAHLEPVPCEVNVRRGRLASLTVEQVAAIRAAGNVPVAGLMARYGVSRATIAKIRSGEVWRGVGEPYKKRQALGPPVGGATMTEAQIDEIRNTPRCHGSGRELAHRFGVSDQVICRIRKEVV